MAALVETRYDKMAQLNVNIFIPNYLVKTREPGFLFGYLEQLDGCPFVNANITTLLPFSSVTVDLNLDNLCFDFLDTTRNGCIRYLGVIITKDCKEFKPWHSVFKLQKYFTELYRHFKIALFVENWPNELEGNEHCFQLKSLQYRGRFIEDMRNINMAFYYPQDLLTSRFISRIAAEDAGIGFVSFINDTLHQTALQWTEMIKLIDNMAHDDEEEEQSKLVQTEKPQPDLSMEKNNPWTRFLTFDHLLLLSSMFFLFSPKNAASYLYHMKQCVVQSKGNFVCNLSLIVKAHQWVDKLEMLANQKSVVFSQIRFKLIQLSVVCELFHELLSKRVSLALGNAASSLLFDVVLGHIAFWFMYYYFTPTYWINLATNNLVVISNYLMILLETLKSMPAGLKLNCPLNNFLADLFIYHVYLWKNYLMVIKPIFSNYCHLMIYSNLLGLTFPICMLSDLFSLVTMHTYFFYGYMAIIVRVQVSTIVRLFRQFCGKKFNPLRNRYDTFVYDNSQMFIGIVFFIICIFLLPTVLLYYIVFLVFRIISLAIKEMIFSLVDLISPFPVYSFILRLLNSPMITGGLYAFKVKYPNETSAELDSETENQHSKRARILVLYPNHPSYGKLIEYRYDLILSALATQRAIFCGPEFCRHKFLECILTGQTIYHRFPYHVSTVLVVLCHFFCRYTRIY